MTPFAEMIGHASALALLERLLDTRRMPHALLFHGPAGVGKATAARALARALLCASEDEPGCGRCRECELVARDAHSDLLTIRRVQKEDGPPGELYSVIRVDQIRELARVAAGAPRGGRRRVFIIDPADRMNTESQNALLKTLEEPPGAAVLILIAARPHLLLPTVRSRCFAVAFAALRTADLAAVLQKSGLPPAEARARAALAGGRPGAALELDLDSARKRRDTILSFVEAMTGAPAAVADLPSAAASLAGKDEADLIESLDVLEALLRDAARAGLGGGAPLVHEDIAPRLASVGRRLGPSRAAEVVVALERLRGYLRFNTNRPLIAESLLAALAGGPLP